MRSFLIRPVRKQLLATVSCLVGLMTLSAGQLRAETNAKVRDVRELVWYQAGEPITYALPAKMSPVVRSAIKMWQGDMEAVTGMQPELIANSPARIAGKARIRLVLYGMDRVTSSLLKSMDAPVSQLSSHKDAFFIRAYKGQLIVVGSDDRGLAYGILELSRLAGVSPWVWWGDVHPDHKEVLSVPAEFKELQYPSIEYRGLFINDEDWTTQPWSWFKDNPSSKTGVISANIYTRIFHLLLRLRANMIWPAMHGTTRPFYLTAGAKAAADSCGIVIGTSHCEPLMSNANGEWHESERGPYNYVTNRDGVLKYWTEKLEKVGKSQNIYTIGMRGKHDGPMEGVHTLQEKTDVLQKVIDDQQVLLKKYVNPDLDQVPQQFIPYKEVLDIYENGLKVPDNVMLTWCDDNYGYLTRLSDSLQQKRSGGSGVYYHLSYWGRPHDYLWLTTTQPGLLYHEMKNAYAHNARRMWIVNVHDPKVACYDLELFLDMAWDVNLKSGGGSVETHLKNCLIRDYGQAAGEKLYPVMRSFYNLAAIRKPEFMGWEQEELDKKLYPRGISPVKNTEFSFTAFGDEADRYLDAYKKIKAQVAEVAATIPESKKDAFFAAIQYPVYGAADMAIKILEAQRARSIASGDANALHRRNRLPQLKTAAAKSLQAYFEIQQMTDYYNNQLAGGKWKNDMCANPRDMPVFDPPVLPIGLSDGEIKKYAAQPSTSKEVGSTVAWPIPADSSYIARNASSFNGASFKASGEPMLGHSASAVAIPKGQSLRFDFKTKNAGKAVIRTAVIPTQPNDTGDIRYQIQVDQEPARIISFRQKGRTEKWKLNVLRGQAVDISPCNLTAGKHSLTITALDDHIILDQWMVDFKPGRRFYMFPVSANID